MTVHPSQQQGSDKMSLFEIILENAGDVLWTYDFHKDRYTYASPSVFRLRGFTQEEILQQTLYDALTPESAELAHALVLERIEALESGDVSARFGVNDFEQFRKDGSTVMTEVMTTFVTNDAGKVTGIVGIARDITKRVQEEHARKELERKLYEAQKHESINRIVRGVAHELNNTLVPVLGYAELLSKLFDESDKALDYCQRITESTQRATDLIDQLLDYTGSQILDLKFIDLNQAIINFEHLLRSAVRDSIVISIQHDGSCPRVNIDLEKLHQIVINLAFNAQDAMPDGGMFTVNIATVQLDNEQADRFKLIEGKYAQLVFTDSGTGIEPSVLPKIFDPFFSTKDFWIASGLGLSAVYGIVKQHHGHIAVQSIVGKGASFTILLPLHENKPEMS